MHYMHFPVIALFEDGTIREGTVNLRQRPYGHEADLEVSTDTETFLLSSHCLLSTEERSDLSAGGVIVLEDVELPDGFLPSPDDGSMVQDIVVQGR